MIASAAMVICFLATLYPAKQASKLNPIEAIRYG
jgi:lipoprotein-releasing system permease protein